jgi:phosphoglycerate kinase
MQIKNIADADVSGKRVLVRADLDVPIEDGKISDDSRLKALIPTLKFLQEHGTAHITVIGHLGRPGGKVVESLRTAPVAAHLKELGSGDVEVLENLRFDPREESNDEGFAKELATHGDVFVNEAFANCHRAHASIVGIPKFLPSFAGLQLQKEIEKLTSALVPPAKSVAIIGGAKFETKVPLLSKLTNMYPQVLVGGALANDLLKVRGWPVGDSLVSQTPVPDAIAADDKILIPTDAAIFNKETHMGRTAPVSDVRIGEQFVDIGSQTFAAWGEIIKASEFVLWNGPMGVYEEGYIEGTDAIAKAIESSRAHAVIGGGDTAAAIAKVSLDSARVFISTGGGAMLEFLVQGTLPGIEALKS